MPERTHRVRRLPNPPDALPRPRPLPLRVHLAQRPDLHCRCRRAVRLLAEPQAHRVRGRMSLYLRLAIGPVVLCDLTLFETAQQHNPGDEPPPQLAGGQGQIVYPEPVDAEEAFGFQPTRRSAP